MKKSSAALTALAASLVASTTAFADKSGVRTWYGPDVVLSSGITRTFYCQDGAPVFTNPGHKYIPDGARAYASKDCSTWEGRQVENRRIAQENREREARRKQDAEIKAAADKKAIEEGLAANERHKERERKKSALHAKCIEYINDPHNKKWDTQKDVQKGCGYFVAAAKSPASGGSKGTGQTPVCKGELALIQGDIHRLSRETQELTKAGNYSEAADHNRLTEQRMKDYQAAVKNQPSECSLASASPNKGYIYVPDSVLNAGNGNATRAD